MFYRESGQFKTSYSADQAVFPISQDRWFVVAVILFAFIVVPTIANEYWMQAVLVPFLILSLAAIGLNILTGYTGLLSLGTGGFMAVGAYATYKITTGFPDINILLVFLMGGLVSAGVGILFGIPSLRIKGFYLAVATLAAQFFILWCFNKIEWFYNYFPSGTITAPPRTFLGIMVTGPEATAWTRYFVVLSVVTIFALVAKNLVRGRIGRQWQAIRDMDIAAEIIGIRLLPNKLLAFAISSFYCGVAGALYIFCYLGSAETEAFDIFLSFDVLFMIIIGGLGSVLGSFLGAAFIVTMPIIINLLASEFHSTAGVADLVANAEHMVFGGLIVFFLIVEPFGFARLWTTAKEKLRLWPFPH